MQQMTKEAARECHEIGTSYSLPAYMLECGIKEVGCRKKLWTKTGGVARVENYALSLALTLSDVIHVYITMWQQSQCSFYYYPSAGILRSASHILLL